MSNDFHQTELAVFSVYCRYRIPADVTDAATAGATGRGRHRRRRFPAAPAKSQQLLLLHSTWCAQTQHLVAYIKCVAACIWITTNVNIYFGYYEAVQSNARASYLRNLFLFSFCSFFLVIVTCPMSFSMECATRRERDKNVQRQWEVSFEDSGDGEKHSKANSVHHTTTNDRCSNAYASTQRDSHAHSTVIMKINYLCQSIHCSLSRALVFCTKISSFNINGSIQIVVCVQFAFFLSSSSWFIHRLGLFRARITSPSLILSLCRCYSHFRTLIKPFSLLKVAKYLAFSVLLLWFLPLTRRIFSIFGLFSAPFILRYRLSFSIRSFIKTDSSSSATGIIVAAFTVHPCHRHRRRCRCHRRHSRRVTQVYRL